MQPEVIGEVMPSDTTPKLRIRTGADTIVGKVMAPNRPGPRAQIVYFQYVGLRA